MVFLLILGFAAIILVVVPDMRARGLKAESWTFWVLLSIGFVLSLAQLLKWPLPDPTYFLDTFFSPVSAMLGLH